MKKSIFKIPLLHNFSLLVFVLITKIIIEKETGDKNELFESLYTLDFFLSNDFVTIILISLIFIPLGLTIFSIKKNEMT